MRHVAPPSRRFRPAFTLVELMIVVATLAILAALVVPKFGNATDTAHQSGLQSQLVAVRGQLELYKLQHGGQYPTLEQLQQGDSHWAVFTSKTDAAGELDPEGEHGPYMLKAPENTLMKSTRVAGPGQAAGGIGWTYDQATGKLKAVLPAGKSAAGMGLPDADVETVE